MARSKLWPKQLTHFKASNSHANLILLPLSVVIATSLAESIPHSANDLAGLPMFGLQACSSPANNGFVDSTLNVCNE